MSILSGYMVPHPPLAIAEVGRGEERKIEATLKAYDEVAKDIASKAPETIIITSPHSIMYRDYFHISPGKGATGSFARFNAPQVSFMVDYDKELVKELCAICEDSGIPAGTEGERDKSLDHGTMVPLYFINKYYKNYKLVRIGLSGLSLEAHYAFGRMIEAAVKRLGRRAVFVASGDLSHCQKEDGPYGYKAEGPSYDERLMKVMAGGDLKKLLDFDESFLNKAEECGHRSFVIMAGALKNYDYSSRTLSHEATFGVGYGIGVYECMEKKNEGTKTGDPYVLLAVKTIDNYIKNGRVIDIPNDLPKEMLEKRAGVFVSIHKFGMLRGCIGTFLPTEDNIAGEIISNAVSASTKDPRFPAISSSELEDLEINVDVLTSPEPVFSMDELDPKRYGVIVTKGYRRGLLLPDLEGVDSVKEQIDIAKQKAGIRPDEDVELKRFEVVRHI